MTSGRVLRAGLVGAGAISTQHVEAIAALEGIQLAGVVSASTERARALGEQQSVPWSTHLADLLARDDVDLVAICTPSGLHASQALEALRAGKHVVIEKPLALSVVDAEAVVREGEQRHLTVAVISQRRYEPIVRALKASVDEGRLGRLIMIIAEGLYHRPQAYYDSAAWRGTRELDGGVLMNQAIHTVDLLRWMGGPVASVSAHLATLGHRMEAEDTASVSLRFTSGALGLIAATTCVTPEQPVELRVYGDRGHARLVGEAAAEWEVPGVPPPGPAAGELTMPGGVGATRTWGTSSVGFLRQYADVVEAIRSGRPPAVSGHDGRDAVEVIAAAYASDETGRAVELHEVAS
jgi:UDP-N-acetyl-2-amino-2-deoxyglucuronate dehydrogenase